MPTRTVPALRRSKSVALGESGQEALYLRFLSEKQVPVTVKLRDGEMVSGWIEYYDDRMIRLTREDQPNLFIYKEQIRTISEHPRREAARLRAAERKSAAGTTAHAPTGQGETGK
jgi:host factor-I protein